MEENLNKRKRSSNFTSQEEDVLLSLVEKYSAVLENRTTNAVSWLEKNNIWDKVAAEFRSQCNIYRSAKNLRDKYDNLKKKAKVAISQEKRQTYMTGGGKGSSNVTSTDERLAALIGMSASGLENEVDSDRVQVHEFGATALSDISFLQFEQLDETIEVLGSDLEEKPGENAKVAAEKNWSAWNPKMLKSKKSPKLNTRKRTARDSGEEVLQAQKSFFLNEDRRAEERNDLQLKELKLKIQLLELEINLKEMEVQRFQY